MNVSESLRRNLSLDELDRLGLPVPVHIIEEVEFLNELELVDAAERGEERGYNEGYDDGFEEGRDAPRYDLRGMIAGDIFPP